MPGGRQGAGSALLSLGAGAQVGTPRVPCRLGAAPRGREQGLGPSKGPGSRVGTCGGAGDGAWAPRQLQSSSSLELVVVPGECKCLGRASVGFFLSYLLRGKMKSRAALS